MMTRVLLVVLFALPALGQNGPCTEQFIRSTKTADQRNMLTEDFYFFSGAMDKPAVGAAALEKAGAPVAASRKNESYDPQKPERVVVAPSGDMAYEYGTEHVSFDNRKDGKHIDFTAAYLRVWKAVDGKCKIAAEMFEPESGQ